MTCDLSYTGIENGQKKTSDHKECKKNAHDPYKEFLMLA